MEITYFDGENIQIELPSVGLHSRPSNEEINEKYLKGEIRIVTEQARYPLNTIVSTFDTDEYDLKPDFQRRPRWDRTRQSRLIESFVMNVPIPPIYLYEVDYSKYEVMDGKQRLTAIIDFYNDKYSLENLQWWKELEGFKYSELPSKIKGGIDRRYLSSIVLLKETAKTTEEEIKLKQLVFDRINSGGVRLEYQESRNAMHTGDFNNLLIKLARDINFCAIFGIPVPTEDENISNGIFTEDLQHNKMFRTMGDTEMVLRFFAMRHVDMFEGRTLKDFLDLFMEQASLLPTTVLRQYEELFTQTIRLVYDIYGDNAFCMWRHVPQINEDRLIKNQTKALYDPMMFVLSQLLDHREQLLMHKDDILRDTRTFHIANRQAFDGRNISKADVVRRIELFEDFYKKYIND